MLASVLQAASSELRKTKASEAFVHLVSIPIRLYFIITSRGFTREDVCLGSQAKSKNAEPHPAFTPRRRGAKKPRTGLRHRPEKRRQGATPARRSKSVASAPNPRAKAIAHTYYTGSTRRHAKRLPHKRRRLPPDVLRATRGAPLRPQRHGTVQHDGRRGPGRTV